MLHTISEKASFMFLIRMRFRVLRVAFVRVKAPKGLLCVESDIFHGKGRFRWDHQSVMARILRLERASSTR